MKQPKEALDELMVAFLELRGETTKKAIAKIEAIQKASKAEVDQIALERKWEGKR